MRIFAVLLFTTACWAQQMVIPEEFNAAQRKLYQKIAASVSTPCCNNGIPAAFHESGMALYVQDLIRKAILEGKSESAIMGELNELRLGEQQKPLIFTVPENDGLGWLVWVSPAIAVLLGILGIAFFLDKGQKQRMQKPSDDELIERYRQMIQNEVKTLSNRPAS